MTYLCFSYLWKPVTGEIRFWGKIDIKQFAQRTFWPRLCHEAISDRRHLNTTLRSSATMFWCDCADRFTCWTMNKIITIHLNCLPARCLPAFDLHAHRVLHLHTFLISTCRRRRRHHRRPSARGKGGGHVSIPNMRPLTGLISREARRAHAGRISTQVLHHLLRAAERGSCAVSRGRCLPAAQPRWPSARWQNKTSQPWREASSRWWWCASKIILEQELCLYLEALGCATVWRMSSLLEASKNRKETWRTRLLFTRPQMLQFFDL